MTLEVVSHFRRSTENILAVLVESQAIAGDSISGLLKIFHSIVKLFGFHFVQKQTPKISNTD